MKQRENSGVLFKNDRKEKDTHPDYKGRIDIGGTEYWLSAWLKDGAKGKFMSLAVGDPVDDAINAAKKVATQPQQSYADNSTGFDDDIPF